MNVIETTALGKRYRSKWALRDCTLAIPGGHLVALVGPNGAGKSTLLSMAVGLTRPTAGTLSVLGGEPAGSPDALDPVARNDFLASVVEAARDDRISVVLSSHVLAEFERVATYLVVLGRGEVRVTGPVQELIESHGAGLEEIALRYLRAGVPSSYRTEAAE
jgi:ABC-type multidrug transport system ATPase subunit